MERKRGGKEERGGGRARISEHLYVLESWQCVRVCAHSNVRVCECVSV